MSQGPDYAARLRMWLPQVWRERDTTGDLDKLLEVYGELLDAFHATVSQRLYDNFPDEEPEGRHCQDWLLPYFAQLLDVRLVSPHTDGRRAELADAVAWRQRKGTRVSIERIAEAVGQFEVEIQEGWKRVAITPRVDRPLLPERAFGEKAIPVKNATPAMCARHPGLPAATLDLRYCSRAVECDPGNPGAHRTQFEGEKDPITWRQVNRHGVPCKAGSFQDVSRRTADLRTPSWQRGLFHPRRVILYMPPPQAFFATDAVSVHWSQLTPLVEEAAASNPADWGEEETLVCTIGEVEMSVSKTRWNRAWTMQVSLRGMTEMPVRLHGVVKLEKSAVYRFENLWLDHTVEIAAGAARLVGCAARHLRVFKAVRNAPVIDARSTLFKKLEASRGLVRLEYVTVLDTLLAEALEASDSILMPTLRKDKADDDVPGAGCIRYSRLFHIPLPPDEKDSRWISQTKRSRLRCYEATCTTEKPLFWSDTFGHPGCGVLHPGSPPVFHTGAEDGGELGACHDFRHLPRQRAVVEKLRDFLPLGMEAVLITDTTLACAPPKEEK